VVKFYFAISEILFISVSVPAPINCCNKKGAKPIATIAAINNPAAVFHSIRHLSILCNNHDLLDPLQFCHCSQYVNCRNYNGWLLPDCGHPVKCAWVFHEPMKTVISAMKPLKPGNPREQRPAITNTAHI
jgi:hypothetical protein